MGRGSTVERTKQDQLQGRSARKRERSKRYPSIIDLRMIYKQSKADFVTLRWGGENQEPKKKPGWINVTMSRLRLSNLRPDAQSTLRRPRRPVTNQPARASALETFAELVPSSRQRRSHNQGNTTSHTIGSPALISAGR